MGGILFHCFTWLGWKKVTHLYEFLDNEINLHIASQVAVVVKNSPDNLGDTRNSDSIPGSGKSPGKGTGNPLQHSCLGNPMDRGAQWAPVHRVAKSWTGLSTQGLRTDN